MPEVAELMDDLIIIIIYKENARARDEMPEVAELMDDLSDSYIIIIILYITNDMIL